MNFTSLFSGPLHQRYASVFRSLLVTKVLGLAAQGLPDT